MSTKSLIDVWEVYEASEEDAKAEDFRLIKEDQHMTHILTDEEKKEAYYFAGKPIPKVSPGCVLVGSKRSTTQENFQHTVDSFAELKSMKEEERCTYLKRLIDTIEIVQCSEPP